MIQQNMNYFVSILGELQEKQLLSIFSIVEDHFVHDVYQYEQTIFTELINQIVITENNRLKSITVSIPILTLE